jgi:xanthine dehydrogenase/oxidase
MHNVVVRVKRIGGGFGGKGSRSVQIAVISALAARKLNRSIRCVLSRRDDMLTTGQRHPFIAEWAAGVMQDGKILALDIQLFCKAGWSMDVSGSVCNRAMWHIDNCYFIPHIRIQGHLVQTNTLSNTAFRGFGAPQGMFITESIIEEVAEYLGKPSELLRESNLYSEDQETHFDQALRDSDWHIPLLFRRIKEEANIADRKIAIEAFNDENTWKKRGLAIIPTKLGVSFTALHLNQAGALVHIYNDGSVLITIGGTEMGQGLHSKMLLIAAAELDVPLASISISDTSTDLIPNTSSTAASVSSELYGQALLVACRELNTRLAPYREAGEKPRNLTECVRAAYANGVNLSAIGHYKTPNLSTTWGKGRIFDYLAQGVAVAEVEINTLTGEWICRQADIKMVLPYVVKKIALLPYLAIK